MHKLRVINPYRESGSTLGTEVWIDDRRLEGVTRVELLAEINSIYHIRIDLNVRLEELNVYGDPELRVTAQDRARLAAIKEAWYAEGGFKDQEWVRRLEALIEQESTL